MIDYREPLYPVHLNPAESSALQEDTFVLTLDLQLRCPKWGLWPFDLLSSWWNLERTAERSVPESQTSWLLNRCLRIDEETLPLRV